MNIKTQCCGLALMLILLVYYLRQPKLKLNTSMAFFRVLCVSMLGVTLDVASIIAIYYYDSLPVHFVNAICKSYLCSIILVNLVAFMYVNVDISTVKEYRLVRNIYYALFLLFCIAVCISPIKIYRGNMESNVYTYGLAVYLTYVFCAIMIFSNIVNVIFRRKSMNPRRRVAVFWWMILWISASLIQYYNNQMLLVGFACSLVVMILYITLENPETYLERETGLYNRSAFTEYLRQVYHKGQDLTMFELVLLHSVNDNFQEVEITPEIRMEIVLYLRELTDVTIFELADDEFMMIGNAPEDNDILLQKITDRFQVGWGKDNAFTVRIGFALVPDCMIVELPEEFFSLLRYGKLNYKKYQVNDYVYLVGPEMYMDMKEEKEIEYLILDALDNDRVEVFYQPIYSTRENRFVSAEALVRIRDAEGQITPPEKFIPVAEQNGMIIHLGEAVFDKVCEFLTAHHPEEIGLHYIEVNLSVVQCSYEGLAEDYIKIMDRYQINPAWINLEITESASFQAKQVLLGNMNRLMDYGIRFSLDDFGTGQSNLNYIIDMPVDIVKFDRQMTLAYFENKKAHFVMEAAIHMIQGLNLKIVSEGVEEKNHLDEMIRLGVDYIQGFYFSKPLPEREFLTYLKNHSLR